MHHRRGNRGGYRGNHHHHHHQHNATPPKQLYVDTGPDGSGLVPIGYAPQAIMVYQEFIPNEAAEQSGMNGDGWQGPPGGRGGSHHMNGGGGNRRGGYNNQRMPQQHHGNMNRMMPPAFRPQQQPQYMPPYGPPMGGIPGDVLDLSMRMDGMSMASTPTMAPYGDMGPPPPGVQQWNQPTPFAGPPPPQQDDLYGDPMGGGGGYQPPQHQMQQQPPYGQHRSGGGGNNYGNNRMNQNNRGYQPRNQGYIPPMMVQQQNQSFYGNQQGAHFNPSPFSMASGGGGSQTPHEHHMGGGGGHNGSYGGSQAGGQMDDYSMWTDENDEEAKRKKLLRDKGLLAWGDADVSNSKPIRRWIVPEGHEEDFETAMERCPNHLKKKALNEESIRRRMTSDNPAVVAQAQLQAEEEANATMKIGKRPIIPTGWGDLPSDIPAGPEKSVDYDQGSSKGGWDDGGFRHPAPVQQQQQYQQQQDDSSLWSNPLSGVFGGPSSSETRNPFFAHHMQQSAQQQQQQHQYGDNGVLLDTGSVWSPVMDGSTMGPPSMIGGNGGNSGGGVGGGGPSAASSSLPMGMLSMMMMGGGGNGDIDQLKLAEKLKLAVDKGHLDTSLLSVPHIPPNVLDLLTEILEVIPRLDALEEELDKVGRNRPTNSDGEGTSSGGGAPPPSDQATSWMTKDQKTEHDKRVISVVTTKIEVTQLSRKINEKLVECGMLPPSILQQHQPNNNSGNGGPSGPSDGPSGSGGGGGGEFNGNGTAPPDHYYDYSFLG
ncbi:Protein CBR-AIN-2 [Caenorhabditis briggsae]|uniref:Protein CBR-AIN-2 n=2 Tax=Caenorhabditis briggsae TaxID=6238 RepID=A8Y1U5_CAEBR|nr:Protein CBR-AIN-2 [Caenorhabditis briggsae]ULU09805.1 hypothetical protein L3Y34_014290 [Caenorhabditis briggsae]CAP38865.2 Protein CBR-AIN-2 [Caenorhabditis briggsae]